MPRKVIGLTGYKGSGKDTVAEILADYGYTRVAFADPLKKIATTIGWNGSKDELPPCSCCGMLQGRQLLQVLGTEGVRENISDNAWLIAAGTEMAKYDKVVITDVRFLNEAGLVWGTGGHVWRIERPGYHGDGHASEREQELMNVDEVIENTGSLDDLRATVAAMMR